MNDRISFEDIMVAKKLMEEQDVLKPMYLMISASRVPIPYADKWLLWLFVNELLMK